MAKDKKVEQITDMEVDFAQWYTDVCKKAQLIDYSSIKGVFIYRPYGYAIWENIQRLMDAELMGARVAVIAGKEFAMGGNLEVRLLHRNVIRDVWRNEEMGKRGGNVETKKKEEISDMLREKILGFDRSRLEELGFDLVKEGGDMKSDGYTISSGFGELYWNLVQTLSCVKSYQNSIY